jgi:hypothetical protein
MDKRNLGQYDLNKLLRNPMLIHRIQDNLLALKDESIFAQSLRDHAKNSPQECVKMIIDQYKDNPPLVTKIVGKETLNLIEEYEGITLADDLDNVFN